MPEWLKGMTRNHLASAARVRVPSPTFLFLIIFSFFIFIFFLFFYLLPIEVCSLFWLYCESRSRRIGGGNFFLFIFFPSTFVDFCSKFFFSPSKYPSPLPRVLTRVVLQETRLDRIPAWRRTSPLSSHFSAPGLSHNIFLFVRDESCWLIPA